jgi:hypothetical protein
MKQSAFADSDSKMFRLVTVELIEDILIVEPFTDLQHNASDHNFITLPRPFEIEESQLQISVKMSRFAGLNVNSCGERDVNYKFLMAAIENNCFLICKIIAVDP